MMRVLRPLAVFLLIGFLKLWPETWATNSLRQVGAVGPRLDFGLRENLSQMGFAASLGGLRSLVASITYLQAFEAFSNTDWAQVDSLLSLTTALEPHFDPYWDELACRMAYDAASYYENDPSRPELYRYRIYDELVARGVMLTEKGLVYNPKSRRLHELLARLYEKRVRPPDRRRAAYHYKEAFLHGGLPFTMRFSAYNLVELSEPQADAMAYKILSASHQSGYTSPKQEECLRLLEKRMPIPEPKRIYR
jgi:hypothetical protein